MQLGTSLSYIEDIKEGLQKRYNALKAMLQKYNKFQAGKRIKQLIMRKRCLRMLQNIILM